MTDVPPLYPLIIAHRGDSFNAPENTLAAFRLALEKGADGIEFDVQLSQDGVPVVIHDANLKRTGNRMENVGELSASELGKADVGSWFNDRFPKRQNSDYASETVPTLAQVLDISAGFTGPIYIELKYYDNDHAALARAVCDEVRSSPLLPQIIVKSFALAAIPIVRFALPEVQNAALFAPEIMNFLRRKKHIILIAKEFGAHQISLHHSLASRKLVGLAREAHMPVTIWTADDPKWLERCQKRGITTLITNDPGKILAVRDKKKPG